MESARVRAEEPDRLEALARYDILDSEPEQAFDDIVHLTARLCQTPVALVSLVDRNRQWFKAKVGFPVCQTDLDSSVCKYALAGPDLVIIPDLSADPRTLANPLVTHDPAIRFYAGAPLITPDGHILGSLCAIDTAPRPGGLTLEQQKDLKVLARQTASQLESRRVAVTHRRADRRNEALMRIGDRLRDLRDPAEMAAFAGEMLGRTLDASRAGYAAVEDAEKGIILIEADWRKPGIASIAGRHNLNDFGAIAGPLAAGQAVNITDARLDPRTSTSLAAFEALGVRSVINIPLLEHGRLVAIIFVHYDHIRQASDVEDAFIKSAADRTRASIARVRAEDQQAILNSEISHRLKNTLAMVQAIASQTLKRASPREAVDAFDQRLRALSSAHDVLFKTQWASADLAAVVRAVTDNVGESGRCEVVGPEVSLGPRATLSTSLLIHELATNALKYGALGAEGGRVQIRWRVEDDAGVSTLVLTWVERGGPPAVPPKRKGFGSRLLGFGLLGTGGSTLSYTSDGFEAAFTAPLVQAQSA